MNYIDPSGHWPSVPTESTIVRRDDIPITNDSNAQSIDWDEWVDSLGGDYSQKEKNHIVEAMKVAEMAGVMQSCNGMDGMSHDTDAVDFILNFVLGATGAFINSGGGLWYKITDAINDLYGKDYETPIEYLESISTNKLAFNLGRLVGDIGSLIMGLKLISIGGGGALGGAVTSLATGGVSLTVSATSIAVAAEGLNITITAAGDVALAVRALGIAVSQSSGNKGDSKPELTSSIDKDPRLVKAAEEMGKNERVQQEANHLIDELLKGNENPGLGSKNLFKDVSYLRGRNGARVFYRKTATGYEILGKADKANEQTVINILKKLYE